MPMANIGATSVPRVRGLRPLAGFCSARLRWDTPPGAGARERVGAGGNRQHPANPQPAPDTSSVTLTPSLPPCVVPGARARDAGIPLPRIAHGRVPRRNG
jgi:hypothetical protein